MKQTIRNRWLAGVTSLAAMAGIWAAATMFRPSVSRAITAVEMPAFVFPEVTAQSGEKLMLCTNNLTGGGTVRALIGLLDVSDSTRLVAGTTSMGASLDPQKGGCSLLLPAVNITAGTLVPAVRTGIPVIFIMGPGANAAGGGGGAGRGLFSSLQLVGADGSVKLVTTPTYMDGLLLPAVQLP